MANSNMFEISPVILHKNTKIKLYQYYTPPLHTHQKLNEHELFNF